MLTQRHDILDLAHNERRRNVMNGNFGYFPAISLKTNLVKTATLVASRPSTMQQVIPIFVGLANASDDLPGIIFVFIVDGFALR